MEDQADLIRQQMQEKRAELSEKLQTLGEMLPTETVAQTVESVSETVTSTAENVQETAHTVQEALDLPKQVQEHPWLAVGGAVLVGYLAHGALTARGPGGQSLLSGPLRLLEQFATSTALDLAGRVAQNAAHGGALGMYGPILEGILGQFGSTPSSGQSSRASSANGRGSAKQPAGTAF
jgi:ElaB/YqjD/DUF883 family membrane-anchored ribosome-binding protein